MAESTYTFTRDQLDTLLEQTIAMMIEYRDVHDKDEDHAGHLAIVEMLEGLDMARELVAHGELDKTQAGQVIA